MASENETVADIAQLIRQRNNDDVPDLDDWNIADRIEAAHRREVAELKRDLELTRQQRNRARLDAQEKFGREIAARLRKQGEVIKMAHVETRIAADLRRRLKVAEDALVASLNYNNSEELRKAQRKARKALAAIREEGGAR